MTATVAGLGLEGNQGICSIGTEYRGVLGTGEKALTVIRPSKDGIAAQHSRAWRERGQTTSSTARTASHRGKEKKKDCDQR